MEEEYWEKFKETGSVTDYLSYRSAVNQRDKQEQMTQGEAYGGKHYSDRHDTVGTAHGRV